jgi:large subunit ribosomal protein L10
MLNQYQEYNLIMKREEKEVIVDRLSKEIAESQNFYLTDISTLTANEMNDLRKLLHEKGIKIQIVKNTLIHKAMENTDALNVEDFTEILKGASSIIFCNEANNVPAKAIKAFRKSHERPLVKAAYLEGTLYVGDEKLNDLASLKSKDELIADMVHLLKSPMLTLVQSLQSGQNKLTGALKTMSEKKED